MKSRTSELAVGIATLLLAWGGAAPAEAPRQTAQHPSEAAKESDHSRKESGTKDATELKFDLPRIPLVLSGDHVLDASEIRLGSNGGRAQEKPETGQAAPRPNPPKPAAKPPAKPAARTPAKAAGK